MIRCAPNEIRALRCAGPDLGYLRLGKPSETKGNDMPKPFLPGDPDGRAAAAGRRNKGVPKRNKAQKEADRRIERLLEKQPQLPDGYEPPIVFSAGIENQLMIARACLVQKSLFPPIPMLASLPRYDDFGNFALVSRSAFVNEPF